jgi:hypothetical protein
MAIDPKDLTIDYRKIQSMPFRDRKALLFSSFADQVNSALTPSQRANLFPNYYVQSATSGATPGAGGDPNLSKADYLNRARNGGVSNSDYNRVSGKPEEKGPPKITASEFRAVESNPFLAGYADKTRRVGPSGAGARIAGTGELKGRQQTMKSVYDAYVSAGFSHKQSLAFTAEVGRENNYNPDLMFGTHTDLNGQTNIGMVSMQKDRRIALKTFLGEKGLLDADGKMIQSQETLNAQAQFQMQEIKEKYPRTAKEFLANPDISMEDAAVVLGDDYIRWARKGNLKIGFSPADAARHAAGRDANYAEIQKITEDFKLIADQTTATEQPDAMAVVERVISETPSAVELRTSAENLDINSTPESALAFLNNKERNPDGANLGDVDARLLELAEMGIRKFESENPNLKVEIYGPSSGKRQSSVTQNSQHLVGKALDFEIFEVDPKTGQKTGKRLPNFRTQAGAGEAGDEYLNLHQNIELARIYKKEVIKDQRYEGVYGRSGALFGGEYALDTQHYDIGGAPAADGIMSASQPGGSIFGGYSEEYMRRFGVESAAMPIQQDKVVELAKSAYGPKETEPAVATVTPSVTTPSAVPAVTTAAPAQGVTTSGVTTAAAPPAPESTNYPIKTMAQGGIIPKSADTQIVQRNMSGDIISATKVGENENERMSIEPISKMSADALTVGSYNPVDEGMINSKSQSAPEDKKVSMTSRSVAQPRLSSDPYSNIQGNIKPMSPTARAAMMAARDLSTQRRGYSL